MKICLFDIETKPSLGYVWGKYEQDVLEFTEDWGILSFSMKWLNEKKVTTYALPDFPIYKSNKKSDRQLVKKLWEVMNEADIIIAHNGDSFDIKKANTRFLVHGLKPPHPSKSIDTLKILRRVAKFDSNKLDDVARQLGLGRKVKTGGFDLWKGCMKGDLRSWAKMKKYNAQDVLLLEKVYLRIRAWDKVHPPINIERGVSTICPACDSPKTYKSGFKYTKNFIQQRYQCKSCGKWFIGETAKRPVDKVLTQKR